MGLLTNIQRACAARLKSFSYFANVEVITEDIGDIVNAVDIAIASIGICIVISTPVAEDVYGDLPSVYFNKIPIVIEGVENVLVNRAETGTQKTCSDVVEMALSCLHGFTPDGLKDISLDSPPLTLEQSNPELIYHGHLKTHGGLPDPTP